MGCTVETLPMIRVNKTGTSEGLERVRYYPRQLITVEDMVVEQEYFRQKMRRHNRMLHGWGVVCGLSVSPAPADGLPWQVRVEAGYALSPQGDEIYVPDPICLDLAKCSLGLSENLCEPGRPAPRPNNARQLEVFVAIRYSECPTRPVRSQPGGCGCDDSGCEFSRIRDDFELSCLLELPPTHQPNRQNASLCDIVNQGGGPPCPPCPEDPWVVLGRVLLPNKMETPLPAGSVSSQVRRILVSTAMLQQQLIECCCNRG